LLGAFQDACLHFDAAVASEPRWSASVSHSKVTAEGHKTPEVLKLNPRGQVPVLKDGDTVVSESLATSTWKKHTLNLLWFLRAQVLR